MKKFLIVIFIFSFLHVYSQVEENDTLKSEQLFIYNVLVNKNNESKIFYKTTFIPKMLIKELRKRFGNFKIVNPKKEFRKNDVTNNKLPINQLIFLIQNSQYYSLVFRRGGRGMSTYFVFASIKNNTIDEIYIYSTNQDTETVEEFLNCITKGNYSLMNWLN